MVDAAVVLAAFGLGLTLGAVIERYTVRELARPPALHRRPAGRREQIGERTPPRGMAAQRASSRAAGRW